MPPSSTKKALNSAGHKLGQIIGDWWEKRVVAVLLAEVAADLNLFLDHRFLSRPCRTSKILWDDEDGNSVDYDFVLELGGNSKTRGIPVGFIESFWRGGARHSKDKARDDTNKLLPMRDTYPTARMLAIAACGEFTAPAREYVRTRIVELFFIPKSKILEAFRMVGMNIDYPDTLSEDGKQEIVAKLITALTPEKERDAASALRVLAGERTFESFKSRITASLSALPQEIRIVESAHSDAAAFKNVEDASSFLDNPRFNHSRSDITYKYSITYSDGFEFSRSLDNLDEVRNLHSQVDTLVRHIHSALDSESIA